jgi:hypothetical protein
LVVLDVLLGQRLQAKFVSLFAWQGKMFDAKAELARPQGMHRSRLLRDVDGGAMDPRRDWNKTRLIDFALQF